MPRSSLRGFAAGRRKYPANRPPVRIRRNPPEEIQWLRYPSEWHVPILTEKTARELTDHWRTKGWIPTSTKADKRGVGGVLTIRDLKIILGIKEIPREGAHYIKVEFPLQEHGEPNSALVSRYIHPKRKRELAKKWAQWRKYSAHDFPFGQAFTGEIRIFGDRYLIGIDRNFYEEKGKRVADAETLQILSEIKKSKRL